MDDLISRKVAIHEIHKQVWLAETAKTALVEKLSALRSADAVEVVRCKDCRYWQDNNGGYPHKECRWGHDETPDADDYCSYGERKE